MFKKATLFGIALLMQLSFVSMAQATSFKDTLGSFQDGVKEQSTSLEDGVEGIELPTFQEDDPLSGGDGVSGVVTAIQTAMDFLKLIIAPISVLVIIAMGIRMITAGRNNDEVMSASKNFMLYGFTGLLIVFVADSVVNVFFGAEGEIFRYGETGARYFAREGSAFIEGIYTLVQVLIGAVAVFMLVVAGLRYVGGSFSEEETGKAKRQITWSLVGLFVIAISELVVKEILFADRGESLGVQAAKDLFAQVTNFVAGTMGTLAFAFLLYAGYMYVTAAGNEDNVSKAKKIIMWAFVGLILAGAAFAITNTLVTLDATR